MKRWKNKLSFQGVKVRKANILSKRGIYIRPIDVYTRGLMIYLETLIYLMCFFRFHWGLLIVASCPCFFLGGRLDKIKDLRKSNLVLHLGNYLYYVKVLMMSGKSLEQSWILAYNQCFWGRSYSERLLKSLLENSIKDLRYGLEFRSVIEQLSSLISDPAITDFTRCLNSAIRKGETVITLMDLMTQVIRDKSDTEMEIQTILSGKRFELFVMKCMPIVLILSIHGMAPDYLDSNYNTWLGQVVMFCALFIVVLSQVIANRIYVGLRR